ncbi:hypothetical protein CCR85_06900 [Rhodothalassium salexigens]|uniref:type II toxin-antitoxin system VapC family toxin n=1 Tax=Rhodothalassium salexigens TaxID=1086 RepID=UPI0019113557|nr:type II toxin-antitoxin system VapC family toxin [Rhodothalassium salexigens]MBK5911220.1 hypothetical protein [Rhodothalassium salexigens]MBK5919909.1 hypothetical protein [Rhodothalassium salexigens]
MGAVSPAFLIDTNVLLLSVLNPARLSAADRVVLEDGEVALVVSAASAWEIATKWRIGKLPDLPTDLQPGALAQTVRGFGLDWLAIDAQDASVAGALPFRHRDPFDRMIYAQAMRRAWPVLSVDPWIRNPS